MHLHMRELPVKDEEIYENLCIGDHRNPDYEECEDDVPRADCFCDNCFYRRDALAMEILRLKECNTGLASALNRVRNDLRSEFGRFMFDANFMYITDAIEKGN